MSNTTPQPTVPELIELPDFSFPSTILRVGITGGIASGKSYICEQLLREGHHVFNCDVIAKRIIRTDAEVKRELKELVGTGVYDAEGNLVKSVLAAYLCQGKEYAYRVNAIVHPRVAKAFAYYCQEIANQLPEAEQCAQSCPTLPTAAIGESKEISVEALKALPPQRTVFMECAILFESGFNKYVDHSVHIHVSHATQIARLMARDHISADKAEEWMALQLPEQTKLIMAEAIIINE